MTGQRDAGGRNAFLGLALVILGGLLFAAGVMVGRQMQPSDSTSGSDTLHRIDQRDRQPVAGIDGGTLSYPEELSKPVKVPRLPPKPEPKPQDAGHVEATSPGGDQGSVPELSGAGLFLQLASYRERSQAQQLIDKLTRLGIPRARLVEGEVEGKGTYYRVRIGPFSTRTDAEVAKQRLEASQGFKALIVLGE